MESDRNPDAGIRHAKQKLDIPLNQTGLCQNTDRKFLFCQQFQSPSRSLTNLLHRLVWIGAPSHVDGLSGNQRELSTQTLHEVLVKQNRTVSVPGQRVTIGTPIGASNIRVQLVFDTFYVTMLENRAGIAVSYSGIHNLSSAGMRESRFKTDVKRNGFA
jgi:hypothetical protein